MKIFLLFLLFIFEMSSSSYALEADFGAYLRGGTGLNAEGGQQECFFNEGIPGNFMRLGNECGFYSELIFSFNNKKPEEGNANYFKTQLRLEFNSKGTRQWEPKGDRDINQIEAFVSAGGFAEIPGDYWIGKRFYRDVDLHIFDWYYYADMSGVGAGVENLPLGVGKFSVAHLIQGNETLTSTSVGRPVLQALDLRWKNLQWKDLLGEQYLNLWGVYAWAPASSDATNSYVASRGYSAAARLQGPVLKGNNNFSLLYGKGPMKDFNIYANSAVLSTDDSQNKAWTFRVVEDWVADVTDKWALMVGAAAEFGDNGTPTQNHRQWQEVGVRPIYFVTDRFQWVFEVGYSRIKNDSEVVAGSGELLGERGLGRITVAPQLSIGKGIWLRPVMRAFLSHSFWTTSNRSYIADAAPTFKDKNEGTTLGYQFEAWF
ncbi:MAG: carbohydrate porin [Pseudobdellovibrionaceae bacterium]